jgi:hypothetical protein
MQSGKQYQFFDMLFSMEEQLLPKSENAPPWLIIFLETASGLKR